MATIDGEMKDGSVYSLLVDSLKSNLTEEPVFLEDVAWADSCLNKDADSTDTNWSFVHEAFMELLSSRPVEKNTTEDESSELYDKILQYGTNIEILAYDEVLQCKTNIESLEFSTVYDEYEDEDRVNDEDDDIWEAESMGNVSEKYEDDMLLGNTRARVKKVFRANYTEDDVINSLEANKVEPLSEDLFKIWDLESVNEEDEFSTELSKALSETLPPVESSVDESNSLKDFVNVSVDDLIAGLGDLSLEQVSKLCIPLPS